MTPDLDLDASETRATRTTSRTTTVEPTEAPDPVAAKHQHLKANPRRRRGLYALIIFLALAIVALAIVDIFVLRDEPTADLSMGERAIEFAVYGLLAVLLIWAILMLFSGKSGKEAWTGETTTVTETMEEQRARMELERALMQCPDCKSVFQFGEAHFRDNRRTAFSCPVCGVYSKLPDPDVEPVKVLRPEGEFKELHYHCTNCDEDIAVGTFGETPLHLVRFRACPHCGERGHIERTGASAPTGSDAGFVPV